LLRGNLFKVTAFGKVLSYEPIKVLGVKVAPNPLDAEFPEYRQDGLLRGAYINAFYGALVKVTAQEGPSCFVSGICRGVFCV